MSHDQQAAAAGAKIIITDEKLSFSLSQSLSLITALVSVSALYLASIPWLRQVAPF
jgi:hypothetical protein